MTVLGGAKPLGAPHIIGESTPSYLLYGERVAKRVRQVCPNIKLIVLLRNPVKRAYSHYCMAIEMEGVEGHAQRSFEELVRKDLDDLSQVHPNLSADQFQEYADQLPLQHGCHSYVGRGLYCFQLELWLRVFPRSQILILSLDQMKTPHGAQVRLSCCGELTRRPSRIKYFASWASLMNGLWTRMPRIRENTLQCLRKSKHNSRTTMRLSMSDCIHYWDTISDGNLSCR